MIKYEYIVVDSRENELSLVACYTVIEDGHVCFCDNVGQILHAIFQPISSLRLGRYNEED